jgi:hypothetical protein
MIKRIQLVDGGVVRYNVAPEFIPTEEALEEYGTPTLYYDDEELEYKEAIKKLAKFALNKRLAALEELRQEISQLEKLL